MSNAELESERPVSTTELAEAFGLGGALSEIRTTLGFVRGTVEKTDSTVTDMSGRMGAMEIRQGEQGQQIRSAFQRIETLEGGVKALQTSPGDTPSRAEFVELKTEVAAGRLSWPKVGTLIVALGGIMAIIAVIDSWSPAT